LTRLGQVFAAEVGSLAALAAHALDEVGPGPDSTGRPRGLAAVETAIRTSMTRLGGELLEGLINTEPGHVGPRTGCGEGHRAGFVAYRNKTIDTVLGPVRLRRAWYHCDTCRHGHAPADARLGITGTSVSPGLSAMIDRAGARTPDIVRVVSFSAAV
jgi:hypothetical protein